jgi:GWxTD domain-containing protein
MKFGRNYSSAFTSLLILVVLYATFLSSCGSSSALRADQERNLYDWEAKILHPSAMVYHQSADSSTFYFKLLSDELLYTRAQPNEEFSAKLKFFLEIKQKSTGEIDSLFFTYEDINPDKEVRQTIGKHRFPLADGEEYVVKVNVRDLSRKSNANLKLNVLKTGGLIRENMLIIAEESLAPIFGSDATIGAPLLMSSDRLAPETLYHSKALGSLPLPPPPYSYSEPKLDVELGESSSLTPTGAFYSLELDTALNVIRNESGSSSFALFGRTGDYPEVRDLDQLIESMRYITSRSEFKKITSSSYPKKALDEFWIETAGSKEKARELIKTYYRRVREANLYFSSISEGWKSDRGLVHIVFGNPNKILLEPGKEVWVYGEDSNISALTFTFKRTRHPYSSNVYILDRSSLYKPGWDQAVANWRRGRVFSE